METPPGRVTAAMRAGRMGVGTMSIEHQLRRAAARCLSLLQRYHQGEPTAAAKERMAAEVEVIIGWLMELDLPPGAAMAGVLKPVEAHLLSHYGRQAGRRLNDEFVEAFGRAGMPLLFNNSYMMICAYNLR